MFDGLVSRPIFTLTDRVMGVHQHISQTHQCRHAHGVFGIVHKHQEGTGEGQNAAVQRQKPISDGRHTKFSNTVVNIITIRLFHTYRLHRRPVSQVGARQIC